MTDKNIPSHIKEYVSIAVRRGEGLRKSMDIAVKDSEPLDRKVFGENETFETEQEMVGYIQWLK